MIIRNLTRKTVLVSDAKLAESFLDRNLGLLRKSNPRALIFKTRFGIHSFGLKEGIDILIVDGGLVVWKTIQLKPNSIIFWNPRYSTVIELPQNTVSRSKTKKGD